MCGHMTSSLCTGKGKRGRWERDFPDSPVVKNPPSNAGDVGSILVEELKSHMPWGN